MLWGSVRKGLSAPCIPYMSRKTTALLATMSRMLEEWQNAVKQVNCSKYNQFQLPVYFAALDHCLIELTVTFVDTPSEIEFCSIGH